MCDQKDAAVGGVVGAWRGVYEWDGRGRGKRSGKDLARGEEEDGWGGRYMRKEKKKR